MMTSLVSNVGQGGPENTEITQLDWFTEFCTQLDACRTLQPVFELAVKYIRHAFQVDRVTLHFSERGEELQLRYGLTADGSLITDETWSQLDGLGRLIQQAAQPVVISGAEPDDRLKLGKFLRQRGVVALVALPLLPETNTLVAGVLLLQYRTQRTFAPEERRWLHLYTSHLARAIEHVRLLEEFRQRDVDLHTVVDTVHMMISTLEVDELLKQASVRLAWVSGMEDCSISAYEVNPDRVRTLAHYNALGVSTSADIGQEYLLTKYPSLSTTLWGQQALMLRLSDPNINPEEADLMRAWGYEVVLILPLKVAGQPIGLIELYSRSAEAKISNMDMRRLQLLAEQVALALVNARLYQSECEQRALAEALRKISLTLSNSLKSSAILDVLLEQLANVVPYDSCCVMLVEGEHVRIAVERGYERWGYGHPLDFDLRLEEVHNLHDMAVSRRPMVISDVAAYPAWLEFGPEHIRSWVGAPLVVRDRLLGFLSLDKSERNFYTTEHANRLEMLAGHASIALWNALAFGEVEQASITDFLTGAYNHRHFQQQLRVEIDRAVQFRQPLSLVMVDLDHFKRVNDRYGHLTGDRVLRQLTTRLQAELRSVDFLARYGGEEFAILLPGTTPQSLKVIGSRLLKAVNSEVFAIDTLEIPLTISAGGSSYPTHASDVEGLIASADQALYRAKDTGRNRFCMAGEG
ncbi:MAG: diguanylate cyclase [Chloroflexota bacterium]